MTYHIFISYSREDDSDHAIHKFIDQLRKKLKVKCRQEVSVFIDDEEIRAGDHWSKTIEEAAKDSFLVIAFLSPRYFRSQECLREWQFFWPSDKRMPDKSIIPIEYSSVEKNELSLYSDDQRHIIDQARALHVEPWNLLQPESKESVKRITHLASHISERLKQVGAFDPPSPLHNVCNEIDELSSVALQRLAVELKSIKRQSEKTLPVCVIYTGGTVGLVTKINESHGSVTEMGDSKDIMRCFRDLAGLSFDIDFYSFKQPFDSSNATSSHWNRIAGTIQRLYKYYQGFVILHGTNTMAYTASALSFMFENLCKPVILTGSDLRPEDVESHAIRDVKHAVKCAASQSPWAERVPAGVSVFFGGKLIRGNRCSRHDSMSQEEGFYSRCDLPLGKIDRAGAIQCLHFGGSSPVNFQAECLDFSPVSSESHVGVITVYPDMDIPFYALYERENLPRGIILRTFGCGDIPTMPEFLSFLQSMLERDVVIVCITQCPEGSVKLRAHETSARLFELGIANGGDMTLEAAYCKLKYLISRYDTYIKDRHNAACHINREIQINMRGERSDNIYSIKLNGKGFYGSVFVGNPEDVSHFRIFQGHFEAQIRITGFRSNSKAARTSLEFYYHPGVWTDTVLQKGRSDNHRIASCILLFRQGAGTSETISCAEILRELIRPGEHCATLEVISTDNTTFEFDSIELFVSTKLH